MNAPTSINYVWWVAAGGATGALLQYLAAAVIAPRIGSRAVIAGSTACACLLLGGLAADEHGGGRYAFVVIGLLSAIAPLSAIASQLLYATDTKSNWRGRLLFTAFILLVGVSTAILGYMVAGISSYPFDKFPGRLQQSG